MTIILLIFRVRIPVEGFRRTSSICFSNPWVSPHAPFLHHPTHFVRFPLLFRFEGLNYDLTVLNQETCSVTPGSTRSSPPSSPPSSTSPAKTILPPRGPTSSSASERSRQQHRQRPHCTMTGITSNCQGNWAKLLMTGFSSEFHYFPILPNEQLRDAVHTV